MDDPKVFPLGPKNFPAGASLIYWYRRANWHVRICCLIYPVGGVFCYDVYVQHPILESTADAQNLPPWKYLGQSIAAANNEPAFRVCAKTDRIVLLIKSL